MIVSTVSWKYFMGVMESIHPEFAIQGNPIKYTRTDARLRFKQAQPTQLSIEARPNTWLTKTLVAHQL